MKNTLADLNDHLFSALERLNSEDLDLEELKTELKLTINDKKRKTND